MEKSFWWINFPSVMGKQAERKHGHLERWSTPKCYCSPGKPFFWLLPPRSGEGMWSDHLGLMTVSPVCKCLRQSHAISTTALQSGHHYLHCTGEETEVQRHCLAQGQPASYWGSRDWNSDLLAPEHKQSWRANYLQSPIRICFLHCHPSHHICLQPLLCPPSHFQGRPAPALPLSQLCLVPILPGWPCTPGQCFGVSFHLSSYKIQTDVFFKTNDIIWYILSYSVIALLCLVSRISSGGCRSFIVHAWSTLFHSIDDPPLFNFIYVFIRSFITIYHSDLYSNSLFQQGYYPGL